MSECIGILREADNEYTLVLECRGSSPCDWHLVRTHWATEKGFLRGSVARLAEGSAADREAAISQACDVLQHTMFLPARWRDPACEPTGVVRRMEHA